MEVLTSLLIKAFPFAPDLTPLLIVFVKKKMGKKGGPRGFSINVTA